MLILILIIWVSSMLPNFLCVGAQKAGTTTLYDILNQHPDIYLPKIKETKYFAADEKFNRGLDYYERKYFFKCMDQKAVGEIDPEIGQRFIAANIQGADN